jgi:hypothetical protein
MSEVSTGIISIVPNANWNGSEMVIFAAIDQSFDVASDTVRITVTGVNDRPELANPIEDFAMFEDVSNTSIDLTNHFTDLDLPYSDSLSWSVSNNNNVEIVIAEDGSVTINPPLNWAGQENLIFTATDRVGENVSDTVHVTIHNVNDNPYVASEIADYDFDEDTSDSSINLNNVFSDYDLIYGDNLSFNYVANNNIGIVINEGLVTLTPIANFNGTETLTFIAYDEMNTEAQTSVDVTINNINDDPTINLPEEIHVDEDRENIVNFFSYVDDMDNLNTDLTLSSMPTSNIDIQINEFNCLITNIVPHWNGSEIVTFSVNDGMGRSVAEDSVLIVVDAVNDSPVVEIPIPDITFDEDNIDTSLNMHDYFDDADLPNDNLTFANTLNANLTISFSIDGQVTIRPTNENWFGTEQVVFICFDEDNTSARDTINVVIESVNDDPVIELPNQFTFVEDTQPVYDFSSYISDVENDSLSISMVENENISVLINMFDVQIIPNENWFGTETLTFSVTDTLGGNGETQVDINVLATNDAPVVLNAIPDIHINEDSALDSLDVSEYFTDYDLPNDQLQYSASNPSNLSIIIDGDYITIVPANDFFGSEEIVITATDQSSLSVSDTIEVFVHGLDDPAQLTLPEQLTFTEDIAFSIDFTNYIYDSDSDSLLLTWSDPIHFTIADTNLVLTFTPEENWNGTEEMIFTLQDFQTRSIVRDTVNIVLNPVNDPVQLLVAEQTIAFNEDTTYEILINELFSDPDNEELEITTFTDHLTITQVGGNLNITPEQNWNGSTAISVVAVDQGNTSVSALINVMVAPVNDDPEFTLPDQLSFVSNNNLNVDFANYITDVDNDLNELQITWFNNANIDVELNETTVTLTNATSDWYGTEYITFVISDDQTRNHTRNRRSRSRGSVSKTVLVSCLEDSTGNAGMQTIALQNGWNLVSFSVSPIDANMMTIFDPIIQSNNLVKIQDEAGRSVEYLDFLSSWINNIGSMMLTEGYYVKVNADCELDVTGVANVTPLNISLSEGWNIIGFPSHGSMLTSTVFSELQNNGQLEKVQNESGNAIVFLNGIGWIDNINNLQNGEGYYIKVTEDTQITVDPENAQSREDVIMRETTHFVVNNANNGYNHANVIIDLAELECNIDDEIAVVTDNGTMDAVFCDSEFITLNISADDPETDMVDGFVDSESFRVIHWNSVTESEHEIEFEIVQGNAQLSQFGVTFIKPILLSNHDDIIEMTTLLGSYPNPVNFDSRTEVSIRFNLKSDSNVQVDIYNVKGQKVANIYDDFTRTGKHNVSWNGKSSSGKFVASGVYYMKLRTSDVTQFKKLLIIK